MVDGPVLTEYARVHRGGADGGEDGAAPAAEAGKAPHPDSQWLSPQAGEATSAAGAGGAVDDVSLPAIRRVACD